MIINFNELSANEFQPYQNLVDSLLEESGISELNCRFKKWIFTEYGIEFLSALSGSPAFIYGLNIPDEMFTFLTLKYDLTVSGELV